MRNTTLYIDREKVKHNIELIKGDKDVCLMVKANNYGMGYDFISEFVQMGYNMFGVATIQEADLVRQKAPNADILIVSYVDPLDYDHAKTQNYILTAFSDKTLDVIENGLRYHLKFDTGMGRIGFFEEQIDEIKKVLDKTGNIPEGMYSHLPCACDEEYTLAQIERFRLICEAFNEYDIHYKHIQNSVASLKYNVDFTNLVRPGLAIWGYGANEEERAIVNSNIQPALSLVAKIHMVKEYDGLIGYDHIERASGTVGTVRIGYHDGFARKFQGYKFASGAQIVGKICMCQMFVELPEEKEYSQLEIFGSNESIYDLVEHADITVYELLSVLANRILKEVI